ncbi:MAG: hypothetical protein M0Q21_00250 [Ignavibacteriaceae bacterium]|nr:hypothetical protein [Ignavibacteriaceae bacterium]
MNNLTSFDWDLNKGDYINYEIDHKVCLVRLGKRAKPVKKTSCISLTASS